MANLNIKGFVEILRRFEDAVSNTIITTEENERIKNAQNRWISEDYSSYEPLQGEELSPNDCEWFFQSAVIIASYCTHCTKIAKELFKSYITYEEFLATAYYYKFLSYSYNFFILIEKVQSELKSLSFDKFIRTVQFENLQNLTEYDLFELLSELDKKEYFALVEKLPADRKLKSILKTCIIEGNEDFFCNYIVENNIEFGEVVCASQVWHTVKRITSLNLSIDQKDTDLIKSATNCLSDKYMLNDEIQRDITLPFLSYMVAGSRSLPNLNWCHAINHYYHIEASLINIHIKFKTAFTDIKAAIAMDEFIVNNSFYNNLKENLSSGKICTDDVQFECQPLESFRDTFISELPLPPALCNRKDSREHIESNFSNRNKDFCCKLYKALVKHNYLSYDSETYYSFIYRMSYDYHSIDNPQHIVWYGAQKDLFYFIYKFAGGTTTKIWKRTSDFFILYDGSIIKINGAQHSTGNPSDKMKAFLKEFPL